MDASWWTFSHWSHEVKESDGWTHPKQMKGASTMASFSYLRHRTLCFCLIEEGEWTSCLDFKYITHCDMEKYIHEVDQKHKSCRHACAEYHAHTFRSGPAKVYSVSAAGNFPQSREAASWMPTSKAPLFPEVTILTSYCFPCPTFALFPFPILM